MKKYKTLVKILDKLCDEAPVQYRRYHPAEHEEEKINNARSRAFIHLFLKVKFGLLEFQEREAFITDGTYDGGIDAYYIDRENYKIYFVQSKFRTNEPNFQKKNIALYDLLKMDVDRIAKGVEVDQKGNQYNGKIQDLIRTLKGIKDIGRYDYVVVILANVDRFRESDLKKLVSGFEEIQGFDHEQCYNELVFPLISGTYYDPNELYIDINLTAVGGKTEIKYPVKTEYADCHIQILFVPTGEIGKALYQYKNSILKYNPRSYLSLKNNPVNKEIERTIKEKKTNEFALFNNGITMLASNTRVQEMTGTETTGQLYVKHPQIINGGQTAYTLSMIYEQQLNNGGDIDDIFKSKEVMLKIITIGDSQEAERERILSLIQEVSRATNQQSVVKDADRRSNDKIQVKIQEQLFDKFGYFYERKTGEFYDGLRNRYIDRENVINRKDFLQAVHASKGNPAEAYSAPTALFKRDKFNSVLESADKATEMMLAYLCFNEVTQIRNHFRPKRNNPFGVANYGNALRVGRYAVTYVAYSLVTEEITPKNIKELARKKVELALTRWLEFENYAAAQPHNQNYFHETIDPVSKTVTIEVDFGYYYKGKTVAKDLAKFFNL